MVLGGMAKSVPYSNSRPRPRWGRAYDHACIRTMQHALRRMRQYFAWRGTVVGSERGGPMKPISVVIWFQSAYEARGFEDALTTRDAYIITVTARMVQQGGRVSLRDVQLLAGHSSIMTHPTVTLW